MKILNFTILLPTYNRLENLKHTLFPGLEIQDYSSFELLIIDDCSSDGTCEYINSDSFIVDYPNISKKTTYYRNTTNLGSPSSRNVGFKKSKGEWIYMVEDDLQIKESKFFSIANYEINQLTNFDNKIAVISPMRREIGTEGYYTNANGKYVNYGKLSKEIYLDPNIEIEGYVDNTHACSFIKSDIAKKIKYDNISYKYFREESDFYERIKKEGYKIYYLGKKLETYHRMDISKAGGNRKHSSKISSEKKYIQSHYAFLKNNFEYKYLRTTIFIFVRYIKLFANYTKLSIIKDLLSKVHI